MPAIVSCAYFDFTEVLKHGGYFSTLIYQGFVIRIDNSRDVMQMAGKQRKHLLRITKDPEMM